MALDSGYWETNNDYMDDRYFAEELVSKPITVDSLQRILNEYFNIPNDTYAYNLTRVKSAFEIGTMTFDDFEEFTEDITRDLAEYIIKRFSE